MSLMFGMPADSCVGNLVRLDYGLALYCCEGMGFTLFGYGLWTVGLEDGKFLFCFQRSGAG